MTAGECSIAGAAKLMYRQHVGMLIVKVVRFEIANEQRAHP